jgi:predicted 3-demethylubiquinone-9 3-methyltransferase (glyoxalase superfamily)
MATVTRKITPCLWFDTEAEEAANFYVSIFENSKVGRIGRYSDAGQDVHRKKAGTVLTVEFDLDGQHFLALNGGPQFKFDEAISFQVYCEDQNEVDYFWDALTDGGEEGPCGWLKDKFGLSWQIVPSVLLEMLTDSDAEKVTRVTDAFMQMKKFDIAELERVFDGQPS